MKWSEEIVTLTDTELVVVNADKKRISLQKTEAIILLEMKVIKVQWGCVKTNYSNE
jgi:hypothetical protein